MWYWRKHAHFATGSLNSPQRWSLLLAGVPVLDLVDRIMESARSKKHGFSGASCATKAIIYVFSRAYWGSKTRSYPPKLVFFWALSYLRSWYLHVHIWRPCDQTSASKNLPNHQTNVIDKHPHIQQCFKKTAKHRVFQWLRQTNINYL